MVQWHSVKEMLKHEKRGEKRRNKYCDFEESYGKFGAHITKTWLAVTETITTHSMKLSCEMSPFFSSMCKAHRIWRNAFLFLIRLRFFLLKICKKAEIISAFVINEWKFLFATVYLRIVRPHCTACSNCRKIGNEIGLAFGLKQQWNDSASFSFFLCCCCCRFLSISNALFKLSITFSNQWQFISLHPTALAFTAETDTKKTGRQKENSGSQAVSQLEPYFHWLDFGW